MFRLIKTHLVLLCLLALALAIRLIGITWGLPEPGRYLPWTADEATFTSCLYRMDPFHLDLNPGFFGVPSFTVYLLAASLALGSVLGWVKLIPDKSFYVQNLDQRGRLLLTGRLNSVVFAVFSVWILYLLVRRLYPRRPRWVALLAAGLLAVLPTHVTWSHYLSQHPLSTGIATSTNYNGLLLLAPFCLAHFLNAEGRWRTKDTDDHSYLRKHTHWLVLGLVCAMVGFLVVTPYALFDIHSFWSQFARVSHYVDGKHQASLDAVLFHIFGVVMPSGLGWGLYLPGAVGLGWMFIRRKWRGGEMLLLVWSYVYLLFSVRVGFIASASRMLPLLVFFPLLSADLLAELHQRWPTAQALVKVVAIAILMITAVTTAFVDSYFLTDTVRSASSAWILEHIPHGSSIGLLREPWWYSADVIGTDYLHPENTGRIYRYTWYDYNAERLREQPAEYIIVASQELTERYEEADDPTKAEFMALLQREYAPVKTFETRIGLPCIWPRQYIIASGLYVPPDIVVMQRTETSSE
jgi:hypothetical protein